MPLMAANNRSDARGTARVLANMALESIDSAAADEAQEVALNNLYRLLQSFKEDAFFGQDIDRNSRSHNESGRFVLRPPVETNVRAVKEALDEATRTAFGDRPKAEAIGLIEAVLRSTAYPQSSNEATPQQRAQVTSFLKALIERL